jgi:Dna[CI] antecedent, DciA
MRTPYGMLKSKPPVEPIAPTLEKIVTRSVRRAANSPLLAWPLACGSAVAARTQATSFAYGVLRIEVPDAGWRAELQHLAPRYLAALNRYSGDAVNRIEFVLRDENRNQR